MTPSARINAAIQILDAVLAGAPAERALTNWGRASRFAGSGDRAAVRDHVFAALRCRRSFAALGGAQTGRGLMLGALRDAAQDPALVFTGDGHAPAPLSAAERAHLAAAPALSEGEGLDCPDWLLPRFRASLGPDFSPVLQALRHRAPVYLRANLARISLEAARAALAEEGIATRAVDHIKSALEVTDNERKIRNSRAFAEGLVELQDAASQAVVEALPRLPAARVLDYCAGGGGKSLAMAALGARVTAHDADPQRMRDLEARAERARARIERSETAALDGTAPFDLVLLDAPCSGSGSWRRAPEAKWRLTPERLEELCAIQSGILTAAPRFVGPMGTIAYVTCSILREENEAQIERFLKASPGWTCTHQRRWLPRAGGPDGFFLALLARR